MEFCFFLLFLVSIVFIEGKTSVYKSVCFGKREILVIEKTHAILEFHKWRRAPDFKTEKWINDIGWNFVRIMKKKCHIRKKGSEALIWTVIRWGLINGFKSRRTTLNCTLKSYCFTQHNKALDRVRWSISPSLFGSCSLKFCLSHSQWEWSL